MRGLPSLPHVHYFAAGGGAPGRFSRPLLCCQLRSRLSMAWQPLQRGCQTSCSAAQQLLAQASASAHL